VEVSAVRKMIVVTFLGFVTRKTGTRKTGGTGQTE
jgi:hypothetical protein